MFLIMKSIFLTLIVFLSLVVPYSFAEQDVLTIGVIQSLTGVAAEDGTTVVQSITLAAENLQREGITVELMVEDDQSSPRHGLAAAQKLIGAGVDALIAATWDFTTSPLLPLAEQNKVPLFNTSIFPESLDLAVAKGFAYTNATSLAAQAEPFRHYLKKIRPKSVVLVFANNTWGEKQREAYIEIARDLGVEIIDELKPTNFDANEWASITPRVKTKKPDMVALLLNKNDILTFRRRAREIGLNSHFFASANAYDAYRLSQKDGLLDGLCFTYPLERLRAATEFAKRYSERFGSEPRLYADNSYDSVRILVKGRAISRQKAIPLHQALSHVLHEGLAGSYAHNERTSFSTGRFSLVCIGNEGLEIYKD